MKEQFNDGGPAFPNRGDNTPTNPIYDGMSLRDWFAGKAVNGMLSQPPATFMSKHKSLWEPALEKSEHWTQFAAKVAELGYDIADAMLAAREKGETK